jgi:hypothetical protein
VELLPFRLLNHKGRDTKQRVYVVNVVGTIDCADPSRSKGNVSKFEVDQGGFFDCERLAIDEKKVPKDATVFRVKLFPPLIFVRDEIREAIEAQKMIVRFVAPGDPL